MKLEEALAAMREGKVITRKGWASALMIFNNCVCRVSSFELKNFQLPLENLLEEDWEIVE